VFKLKALRERLRYNLHMHWNEATTTLFAPLIDGQRLGLVTDMDGTICPIMPPPDPALETGPLNTGPQITPRSRELLASLATRLPLVAVVSGRAVGDLRARVGLNGIAYVGNHGIEQWRDGRSEIVPEARKFRMAMVEALREIHDLQQTVRVDGLFVEDKRLTITVHYRGAPDTDETAELIGPTLEAIAKRYGLRVSPGRKIFELRPPLDIDKGTTLRRLIEEYALDAAVYIGDDITDVDALRAARELRKANTCYALGVGVESDEASDTLRETADVLASGVADVETFLGWLLNARITSSI
jgi:trehalose 6-phosphate phosphatase